MGSSCRVLLLTPPALSFLIRLLLDLLLLLLRFIDFKALVEFGHLHPSVKAVLQIFEVLHLSSLLLSDVLTGLELLLDLDHVVEFLRFVSELPVELLRVV